MAGQSFLYGSARNLAATTGLGWTGATVWGMLVDATYVPVANSDVHVSDILARAPSCVIKRFGPMTSLSAVNGVCAGVLPQILALINTLPAQAVVLYYNTGNDSTSQLIYYSSAGAGFPLALQGFNYAIANDQAFGGWFQT
jgi:hypothetical protein